MWELICHHTYRWDGLPIDLSHYNCHGDSNSAGFLADGATIGSGAAGDRPWRCRADLRNLLRVKGIGSLTADALGKASEGITSVCEALEMSAV